MTFCHFVEQILNVIWI